MRRHTSYIEKFLKTPGANCGDENVLVGVCYRYAHAVLQVQKYFPVYHLLLQSVLQSL